jgi:hypothetical protein
MPVVLFPGTAGHPCPTLPAKSLSLQGERQILERDDLGPSYRGVRRSVWDPDTFAPGAVARPTGRAVSRVSRERLGDWDGAMEV